MTETLVEITQRDAVRILTLNRPERGNALNRDMAGQLFEAVRAALEDGELKVVALTGRGSRFCTGADLAEFSKLQEVSRDLFKLYWNTLGLLQKASFLTVTFVNGHCLGGGMGLAYSTDFILSMDSAEFGCPEIEKGLFPYMASQPLVRKLGAFQSMAMAVSGKRIPAPEALTRGMLSEMVSETEYEPRKNALIDLWNRCERSVLQSGKALLEKAPGSREVYFDNLSQAIQNFRRRG